MKNLIIPGLVLFLFFWQMNALANVDVFDRNRGDQKKAPKLVKPSKKKVKSKSNKKINITLKFSGASSVGNITRLYFKNKRNQNIVVKWDKDKKVALPEFYDLLIENYENRVLYVRYPENKECVENKRNGIYCEENNLLSMHIIYVKNMKPDRKKPVPNRKQAIPNKNPIFKRGK